MNVLLIRYVKSWKIFICRYTFWINKGREDKKGKKGKYRRISFRIGKSFAKVF